MNAQIIRVGFWLHNFVIDNDNLEFRTVSDEEFEGLEVDALKDGPEGNRGFLRTLPVRDKDGEDEGWRRGYIVAKIEGRGLSQPEHNLHRNQELDNETSYL